MSVVGAQNLISAARLIDPTGARKLRASGDDCCCGEVAFSCPPCDEPQCPTSYTMTIDPVTAVFGFGTFVATFTGTADQQVNPCNYRCDDPTSVTLTIDDNPKTVLSSEAETACQTVTDPDRWWGYLLIRYQGDEEQLEIQFFFASASIPDPDCFPLPYALPAYEAEFASGFFTTDVSGELAAA